MRRYYAPQVNARRGIERKEVRSFPLGKRIVLVIFHKNLHNWTERSMSYLCRLFDNVKQGADYRAVKPAIQIGLLDYTLFPDAPEFYATYYLMNEKTHKKYSDKLRLSVLDLTRIDLATDEDRLYRIDHWAALFKAQTWEDLKMLAQNDNVMLDAVSTVYEIAQDSRLADKIRAREEWAAIEQRRKREEEELQKAFAEVKQQLAEKEAALSEQQAALSEKDARIAELERQLAARS